MRDGVPASGMTGTTSGSVAGMASNNALEIWMGRVAPGSSPRLKVTERSAGSIWVRWPFQIR